MEPLANEYVSVASFYRDRSILVTGGTGFVGKVLIEKLLRSCPAIKNIYLLVRPKQGHGIRQRVDQLLDSPLFDRLRREQPGATNKIVPIAGDVTEESLGISASDQNLLISTVSVVFHSAATVKFDEALGLSVTINMLGTRRLLHLCHRMAKLEALVHVSTAYCNCDREEVKEEIYPPPYDPEKIIQCTEWMDSDLVETLTPKLIGDRPNTYVFTKALAEHMLLRESGNLPVAIVRPSIVLSAWREPLAGWVDNWNGPTGMIAAAGRGFFRTMLCHEDMVADLVPVDVVINLLICTAWRTAVDRTAGIKVYNCTSGSQNPITWKEFVDGCFTYLHKHPMGGMMWYPAGRCRSSPLADSVCRVAFHTAPAYLIDAIRWLTGKRPIMVRIQGRLQKAVQCLRYFSTHQWHFRNENVRQLSARLSNEDRATFPFDISMLNWPSYLEDYILGIRHFVFKEKPDTLPESRLQLRRLYWIHLISKICVLYWVWRTIIMRFRPAPKNLRETKDRHLCILSQSKS
ncbi:putative fatty acyl-CoA reductase CG5065 [Ischnura elegans]|uniref:putative fatty acyl-CoA reductase CG5065 n=1 Tax=Ischnura elegans TaxID=197161 RepID=UPI001ED8B813|nr:putative fatty acyl-CoA reductase CG5065 [Ischnura elegans]XP_046382378.1 putative fatty acyl-CoA reductase CG5065 [Ischnura elegans]XP_046382379.1 putative fatty acyl-CoA reductase CG5065 [Ischnura elegans]